MKASPHLHLAMKHAAISAPVPKFVIFNLCPPVSLRTVEGRLTAARMCQALGSWRHKRAHLLPKAPVLLGLPLAMKAEGEPGTDDPSPFPTLDRDVGEQRLQGVSGRVILDQGFLNCRSRLTSCALCVCCVCVLALCVCYVCGVCVLCVCTACVLCVCAVRVCSLCVCAMCVCSARCAYAVFVCVLCVCAAVCCVCARSACSLCVRALCVCSLCVCVSPLCVRALYVCYVCFLCVEPFNICSGPPLKTLMKRFVSLV